MGDFEDPELEHLLGRAGGAYSDVNLAYERLQVRVRRARRRRATVVGSVAGALLVAFTVVALNRPTDSPTLEPSGRGTLDVTGTFTGEGGSITVRLQDNTLTLESYVATAGFSAEVQNSSGDRVEVRFESLGHETRIRVDLENGSIDPSIEEDG